MLRERLVRLINQPELRRLDHATHAEIVRALLLYSLGRRNSEELRQLSLAHGVTEPLYSFKSQYLDRTHYVASLYWRAVFEYFRAVEAPTADGPATPDMQPPVVELAVQRVRTIKSATLRRECMGDVLLLERFLTLQDHRQLYRLARATSYATPTEYDLLPIVKKLQRYCNGLVRKRMRFLIKHDRGLTAHDLEAALFEAGLVTLHQFDAETNELKLLNTAKRGAHNYFVRLVEYHTAQCRARLVRKQAGKTEPYRQRACGTCAWLDVAAPDGKTCHEAGVKPSYEPCRRKSVTTLYHVRGINEAHACGNCLYYDRAGPVSPGGCLESDVLPWARPCREFVLRIGIEQFVATTASLDAPCTKTGEDDATLGDFIPAEAPKPHEAEWLDRLLVSLTDDEARVVRITLGFQDQGFERWLWPRTYQSSTELKDGQLARYACEFVGVELDDMKDCLRQHLTVRRRVQSRR